MGRILFYWSDWQLGLLDSHWLVTCLKVWNFQVPHFSPPEGWAHHQWLKIHSSMRYMWSSHKNAKSGYTAFRTVWHVRLSERWQEEQESSVPLLYASIPSGYSSVHLYNQWVKLSDMFLWGFFLFLNKLINPEGAMGMWLVGGWSEVTILHWPLLSEVEELKSLLSEVLWNWVLRWDLKPYLDK